MGPSLTLSTLCPLSRSKRSPGSSGPYSGTRDLDDRVRRMFSCRYHKHPVSGEPLALNDLIRITFHKNADGEYHCPVLNKVRWVCCVERISSPRVRKVRDLTAGSVGTLRLQSHTKATTQSCHATDTHEPSSVGKTSCPRVAPTEYLPRLPCRCLPSTPTLLRSRRAAMSTATRSVAACSAVGKGTGSSAPNPAPSLRFARRLRSCA